MLSFTSPASAMMGADLTDLVTAPFSLHKTGDNDIPVPKTMQKAMDLFSSDEEEVDLSGYVKVVQQKVISNFKPQQVEGSPNTVILFKITNRGRIDSYKIIKPSKDELFDYAAVRAVQMSAPFEYLPDEYDKDVLKLQFTFTKHGISINYF
jgi:TonB family protein